MAPLPPSFPLPSLPGCSLEMSLSLEYRWMEPPDFTPFSPSASLPEHGEYRLPAKVLEWRLGRRYENHADPGAKKAH